jgi:hypothetical protein
MNGLLPYWSDKLYFEEGELCIFKDKSYKLIDGRWEQTLLPVLYDKNYKTWLPNKAYKKNRIVVYQGRLWKSAREHYCCKTPDECPDFIHIKNMEIQTDKN